VTKAVNAAIPDAVGNGVTKTLDGKLDVALKLPKKAKGTIGRTAVTFQTTGLAAGAAGDLDADIIDSAGTRVGLFTTGGLDGQSIGPLTIMSNSPVLAVRLIRRRRFRHRLRALTRIGR
jgi:hypothetical protein